MLGFGKGGGVKYCCALNDGAHHYTSGGTRVALWSPALRHFKLTSTISSQYVGTRWL